MCFNLKCINYIDTISDFFKTRAGCSSVDSVPAFEAVGRRIDPSQWTQLQFGLFRSNQWSTTGLSKAVVCTVLSMEKCI